MSMTRKFRELKKPDLTPMIDVTFLLLVFFIVTLKFTVLEGAFDTALPQSRGVNPHHQSEPVEKIDLQVYVAQPGELKQVGRKANGIHVFEGREIRVEVGERIFCFNPTTQHEVPGLREFLLSFANRQTIPLSIDGRKDTVYGDIVPLLDLVSPLGFAEVSFAATFEND
jgi:biopolymer transport protein ExbD